MRTESRDQRVLTVDPTSRGFGYAVLEGPARLVDWGVSEGTRADNRETTKRVEGLIERYLPARLLLEDVKARQSRRGLRVQRLVVDLTELAQRRNVKTMHISRKDVRRMFAKGQAENKEQIADAIVGHCPELAAWRPPVRKLWMSEDARMAIFDAVAFALAYFYFEDEKKPHAA